MYLRIEPLGHYLELGSKEPEAQQVVVVDPGGQLIPIDSDTSTPYVGFYNPAATEEEVEDAETNNPIRRGK